MSKMATIPPPPAAAMAAAAVSGRQAPPAIMTIFGAAGDLTKRLVVPALYNLVRARKLPDEFAIIGVDIADLTTEGWRQSLTETIDAFAGGAGNFHEAIDEQAWSWLTRRMHYLRGDFAQPETFSRLVMVLDEQRERQDNTANVLFYLAVADQAVEVEADGVGMYAEHIGDRDNAHRIRRRSQCPQHLPTATCGFPD